MRNEVYSKVFMWLFIGLAVTFGTGYFLSLNETMVQNLFSGGSVFIILIVEIGIALFFGLRVAKMSKITAMICYLVYCFVTGLTFSTLFIAYEMTSIISVFAITSLLFLIFAIYGKVTKRDLSKLGTFLFMALLGTIIASIFGIFIQSSTLVIVINVVTIVVFLGYIAYDIKVIEQLCNQIGEDNVAIYGAFQLYLDFINVFITLLQMFGDYNNND